MTRLWLYARFLLLTAAHTLSFAQMPLYATSGSEHANINITDRYLPANTTFHDLYKIRTVYLFKTALPEQANASTEYAERIRMWVYR